MEEIRSLRSKISEAAENLRRMGFRVLDDGLISVDYDVTRDARRELEESIKATEVERDQQEAKYRKALFDVWSSQSVDQAREIVSRIVG
jgi:Spy/CpxP family protein refolding chaperone